MKLYHLSHTDLDGYGCQMLTKEFFKTGYFINANYGVEVKQSLNAILEAIQDNIEHETLFLISDLNLTLKEAKELDEQINKLNTQGANIKLQLLDHHSTGEACALKYDWYFLDTSRSATKIVYDFLVNEYEGFLPQERSWIEPLVNAINAIDIWLEDEKNNFEFGKVLMSLITKANEINSLLFANENREYRLWLLKKAATFIEQNHAHIVLDEKIYTIKKEYLKYNNTNDTIDNLSAKFLVKTLEDKKEDLTIFYKQHKGLLTYTLGSISIPANAFLKANEEYDFFVDISRQGSISFRANGKVNVALLAQKLANGGGHPNASGAKLDDFTQTICYGDVKKYLQEKLNQVAKRQ